MSSLTIAAAGLQTGLTQFDSASRSLSAAFDSSNGGDPASALVDQSSAQQQVQASAAVVRASDRMLKQLLDITV
jgi:flagellar hook protein FlgE